MTARTSLQWALHHRGDRPESDARSRTPRRQPRWWLRRAAPLLSDLRDSGWSCRSGVSQAVSGSRHSSPRGPRCLPRPAHARLLLVAQRIPRSRALIDSSRTPVPAPFSRERLAWSEISRAKARPAYRGSWRVHLILASGGELESATSNRDSIETATRRLQAQISIARQLE